MGKIRQVVFGGAMTAVIALAGPALAGEIHGKVTGPGGKPVANAWVVIEELNRGKVTGPDGTFAIEAVPEGPVKLAITARQLAPQYPTVEVPASGAAQLDVGLANSDMQSRSAALNDEPKTEHDHQKAAYLRTIRKPAGKVPNVLVILFDDLGYGDFSSYGNRLIKTPNIDAFGQRGMRLNAFYSSSPVCSPSRTSLMTGRYPMHANMATHVVSATGSPTMIYRRSRGLPNAIPADEILLPEVLSRAGYRTGLFGKWHLGDTPGHRPTDLGFQDYYGLLYSNDMKPANIWRGTTIEVPEAQFDQLTINEREADEAIKFIQTNAAHPFYAQVNFSGPHQPHFANPKHKGVSEGGTYGDVVEDLDANVGRIWQAMRDLKLDENTIVIITSDNGGDYSGSVGNLRGRKGSTWEGGQRVPAFFCWPGHIAPGTSSDEMAMFIDVLPTIFSALKLPLPTDRIVDGKDIFPILTGGKTPHDYLFYTNAWLGKYEAVRNATYKFRDPVKDDQLWLRLREDDPRSGLYDLIRDNESQDISGHLPEVRAQLEDVLNRFRAAQNGNPRGWK